MCAELGGELMRRRLLNMIGMEDEEVREWKLLEIVENDGTTAEKMFLLPETAEEVVIFLKYDGTDTITAAWDIISVNRGKRLGILNSAPSVSGGIQVFKIIKTPFGFELRGTQPVKYDFASSEFREYYKFSKSDDVGINSFTFGSDTGKGASANGVSWEIYYR